MRAQYWLAFVCLFCIHLTFAQDFRPGYIKLKDGADQHGLIGKIITGYPERIEFKSDSTSEIIKYPANEISGYGIDNGVYYSSFQEGSGAMAWNFIEKIVDGDLILLRRNGFLFLADQKKFKIVPLIEKYRLKLRSMMMEGCPFVASQSMRVDRSIEELSAHVTAYNKCVATRKPNYDGLRRPVSFGIMAGFDNSTASFDGFNKTTSGYLTGNALADKSFFQAGGDVTFRARSFSNFLGLYSGLLFTSNSYSKSNKFTYYTGPFSNQRLVTEYNEYTIDFSQVKIPLGFELVKPSRSKVQPHFRMGLVFSKTLKLSSARPVYDIDPRSNGNIYAGTPPKLNSFNVKPLFVLSAGLDYRILNDHFLRLQLSYNTGKATTNTGEGTDQESATGKFTSFSGMVGFIF